MLSCELSRASTPVRWLRDGKAIRKSQKYDLITEGTRAMLVVHAVSPKDSGEYTCETEASKSTASLRVEGDPTRDPGLGPHGLSRGAAHGGGLSLSQGALNLHSFLPPSQKRQTGSRRSWLICRWRRRARPCSCARQSVPQRW